MTDAATPLPRSAAGHRNPWLIAAVVSIATFMQVLDTSIANVALRNIAGGLAAGVDESTWVITSYLVASAVVLPISGWLSDVVGRKRFYMGCVATFTIFSLLCGLAPSLPVLIVCRVLQGIGGGGMAPSEQSILADSFPPNKRAQAFALYGVAVIVAPTVGPTLGGWITDNFTWRWIFFINGPIGLASLALVHWLIDEPRALREERARLLAGGLKVDWVGFLLVALALGCLEVVLDEGQRDDWFASNLIVVFASLSAAAFLLFLPWELSRKDPIVEVRLLFQRQFGASFLMMMSVGAILFGTTQLMPQLLQGNYAYDATLSGLVLMPGGVVMFAMMPLSARLTNHAQPKYLMAGGMALIALAMWHLTSLSPQSDFGFFAWARVYQTVGLPFLFVPITAASYADVPPDKTNQASALINVARNLGGSIGVSVAGALLARREQFHQARLVEHIQPASDLWRQGLARLRDSLAGQGLSAPSANDHAMALVGRTIANQATLLSYIDVFFAYALAAAIMAPVALFLLKSINPRAGGRASVG